MSATSLTLSARTRRGIRYSLTVFVAVRIGLFLVALVGLELVPPLRPVSVPGWVAHPLPDPGWHNLFTSWERFDGLWFLRIAAGGYRSGDGSAAFFPLYPLAIRAVSWLIGGHPFAASLIVSNVSFAAALCVLYSLTAAERSEERARRAVLFLATFPTALFFFAPYSESLFLLLAVTAFWAARSDRWGTAGIAAALAALTRSIGIILAPALVVEAFLRWRERGRNPVPGIAAGAAPGVATLGYLAFWGLRSGAWLAPVHQQANWERRFSWPWATLVEATRFAFRYLGNANGGYWAIDWLIVVPALALSVYAVFRLRASYTVYLWGGLLVPLFYIFPGRPLMSMPRFLLPLFPLFWAASDLSERWRLPRGAVAAVGAGGLALLTVLFVNWYYIF
ncbi:MAG TPA: mannosyltransferase family protein [Actinomycetota bacterium]|jgi:Gpi18-like mannosyltransferase|nr:mannosyltransferase family protein [Actinomycetota bacterium]